MQKHQHIHGRQQTKKALALSLSEPSSNFEKNVLPIFFFGARTYSIRHGAHRLSKIIPIVHLVFD